VISRAVNQSVAFRLLNVYLKLGFHPGGMTAGSRGSDPAKAGGDPG
jgi:hypothetical protein